MKEKDLQCPHCSHEIMRSHTLMIFIEFIQYNIVVETKTPSQRSDLFNSLRKV